MRASSSLQEVVCAAVFARMAARYSRRPWAHAWLVLLAAWVVDVLIWRAMGYWLDPEPWQLVPLNGILLLAAMVVGTTLGLALRDKRPIVPGAAG